MIYPKFLDPETPLEETMGARSQAEAAGLPRPMLVVNRVRPDMVARGEM